MLIVGTRLMGKVDQVPTLGHVATRFVHVYFFPFIPAGSYLIFSQAGDDFRGIPIPLSFKSVLVAWLRAGLLASFAALTVGCLVSLSRGKVDAVASIAVGCFAAVPLGLFIGTYYLGWFTKASYERALHLAQSVGLNEEGLLMLEIAYGRKTAEQADWELEQIKTRQGACLLN